MKREIKKMNQKGFRTTELVDMIVGGIK